MYLTINISNKDLSDSLNNLSETIHINASLGALINGKDGITPHIGENGNWWIGDVDTGVPTSAGGGRI